MRRGIEDGIDLEGEKYNELPELFTRIGGPSGRENLSIARGSSRQLRRMFDLLQEQESMLGLTSEDR